jgi:hypothetical protein
MDRAARRTLELRGHFTGGVLDEGADEFYINPAIIPEGWSYEWKLFSILNEEQSSYQVTLARTGWEPVPADRHPELMPRGTKEKTVMRRGMQLMERPLEITMEARQIEREKARRQVRIKEDQLTAAPPGQFGRDNKGEPLTRLGKSYEAMPVPNS